MMMLHSLDCLIVNVEMEITAENSSTFKWFSFNYASKKSQSSHKKFLADVVDWKNHNWKDFADESQIIVIVDISMIPA